MKMSLLFASGQTMLKAFAIVGILAGVFGAGVWLLSTRSRKLRIVGATTLVLSVIILSGAMTYYFLHPERQPF